TLERPRLRPHFGGARLPLAAAVAGIWMLHPLQTESVTYVSQRAESLAGLFCLLTLYGFIRAMDSSGGVRAAAWRAVSWAGCLLGMATKEVMVAAPLLVLLYDLTLVSGGADGGFAAAWRRRRGYYIALASTWILLGLLVAGTHDRGGTAGLQPGLTPAVYLRTQCHAIGVYLKLSFWPHPLIFDYGEAIVRNFADVWPQAAILGGLLMGTAVALWRRSAAGFAGAWFFAILAPSSSFLPIASQTMAEHRMYLPLAAVVAVAVMGLYALVGRRSLALWPVLACVLGWMTFVRNETYGSKLALWRDTAAKAPRSARARYNLGIVYSQEGQYARAVVQDKAALQLGGSWISAGQTFGIHNKLGYDLAMLGRLREAVAQYEQALRMKPDYALAHLNLARALVRLGRYPEAIGQFDDVLRLHPADAAAESELGDALLRDGRTEEAIAHDRAAVRLAPAWPPAINGLAYALLLGGGTDQAMTAYRRAVRLDPGNAEAWVGLGYALIKAGRPAAAVAPCTEAVKLQPKFADARNILGIAFAQIGRTAEAIACFEQALRFDPGGPDVHDNLGNALAAAGRTAEATAQYREAVRLDPQYAQAQLHLGEELQRAGREGEAAEHLAAAARLEASGTGAGTVPGSAARTQAIH
ncbi:MAG: tetratricopeptide repeat protein, partial [Opitutaceae bacterium]